MHISCLLECAWSASWQLDRPAKHGDCVKLSYRRQGMRYFQKFAEGTVVSKLQAEELPRAERKQTGTSIRFLYDKKIFSKG